MNAPRTLPEFEDGDITGAVADEQRLLSLRSVVFARALAIAQRYAHGPGAEDLASASVGAWLPAEAGGRLTLVEYARRSLDGTYASVPVDRLTNPLTGELYSAAQLKNYIRLRVAAAAGEMRRSQNLPLDLAPSVARSEDLSAGGVEAAELLAIAREVLSPDELQALNLRLRGNTQPCTAYSLGITRDREQTLERRALAKLSERLSPHGAPADRISHAQRKGA